MTVVYNDYNTIHDVSVLTMVDTVVVCGGTDSSISIYRITERTIRTCAIMDLSNASWLDSSWQDRYIFGETVGPFCVEKTLASKLVLANAD